ncbi:hypothetical protein RND81_09G135700 [Saponaria officinalis]|uniref:UBX domain-containing protein n=1 Tax=Saponaria officinalis TaxID=3572 RepID=A0AAW1IKB6_SAPOF
MEGILSRNDKQKHRMVSSFLDIAVGQTTDTARQFLEATSWKLEEAIQLFYAGNEGGDDVRPPLPVKRETLYDDAMLYEARNFEEENKHRGNVWSSGPSTAESSEDKLAALYRAPLELVYEGTFEKAKLAAAADNKWLVANLQSITEFCSHMLNRDTWANNLVAQTIKTNFIFWQVYDDANEGKKVCNYYEIESAPVVLVIDPVTGQKMRSWYGMVQPDRLLEDLLPFTEGGPKTHHRSVSNKRPRRSAAVKTNEEDEELQRALAASMEGLQQLSVEPDVEGSSSMKKPVYPPLPEEPKADRNLSCRVGVRLPDGRRVQRNFLHADPIQLLWSFCSSQLGESETRPFRLTTAIPGASKALEYDSGLTFQESGLSNSMISVTWA